MPLSLHSNNSNPIWQPHTKWLNGKLPTDFQQQPERCLNIGLINNMPDAALEATERQYLSLLDSVSNGMSVRLSLYSLPGVPRNELGAHHIRNFYSSVEDLWNTHLDGLIVTGREPLTPNLADEPYWESFSGLLDWAQENTHSTVWSCLAAHAAILHMDGIGRIKSNDKHCGVFECSQLSKHPLTSGAPSRFTLPHSRWNGVSDKELTGCGYTVLTRAEDVGVDTFIKQQKSLFVFFQGHPEYESNTLLLEYRRDVGRYLRGEANVYPLMPRRYFDHKTTIALTALQNEARSRPREELLAELSTVLEKTRIENTWRSTATCIYRNWLEHLCTQKQLPIMQSRVAMKPHPMDKVTTKITPKRDRTPPAVESQIMTTLGLLNVDEQGLLPS